MTTIIPVGPFITSPLKQDSSGVDFLGLRQANLDMMDYCLPGINNYTRYVRIFSVVSWIYWKFHERAEALDIQAPTNDQLINFKEKAEVLFNWGHKSLDLGGLPGITANPPEEHGEVDLTFDAWGRSADNTSLLAAPTYGPASKTTGGLGFIEPIKQSFYRTRGHGVQLAQALDEELSKRPGYDELISFEKFTGSKQLAEDLFAGWDVRLPSGKEMSAFRASFFDPEKIEDKSKLSRRSMTVSWIIDVLKTAGRPMMLKEVRRAMAYRNVHGKGPVQTNTTTEKAWLGWLVLQVRQGQRLGFEALLAWLEDRVIFHSERSVDDALDSAMQHLHAHSEIFPKVSEVDGFLQTMEGSFLTLEDYVKTVSDESEWCIFKLIDDVLQGLKNNDDTVIPNSLRLLVVCSYLTKLFKESGQELGQLNFGGRERISLSFWSDIVEKWRLRNFEEFLQYVFENFILSQHFGVAASRFDGKRQRLRLTIEEEGLTPMVGKCLEPFIGDDRLEMGLLLLADSGVIRRMPEGYVSLP